MRVLAVVAHADDELLGPGGTLIRHARAGDEVHVAVCVGVPNLAMYGADRYGRGILDRRREQASKVARKLKFKKLHWLGLKDETLEENMNAVVTAVEKVVAAVKPGTVYLHHGGDCNQDHRGSFKASLVAVRGTLSHAPLRVYCFETPSSTEQAPPRGEWAFRPNHFVDVSETLEAKLEALQIYEDELSPFPHPRSLEGLEALARTRGMGVGFRAAEAFELIRERVPLVG